MSVSVARNASPLSPVSDVLIELSYFPIAGAVFMPKPPKYIPCRSGQKSVSASREPAYQEHISLA